MKLYGGPIDPPILQLVEVINKFPNLATFGSCGGHKHPHAMQQPSGSWFVSFSVQGDDREVGRRSCQTLAHLVNETYQQYLPQGRVCVALHAEDEMGAIHGKDMLDGSADDLAQWLRDVLQDQAA